MYPMIFFSKKQCYVNLLLFFFSVMSSLNLPAALEDVSGSEVPASILEKSKTVISKGGAAPIDQLLQELPDSLARNQEILSEVDCTLVLYIQHII